MNICFVRHKYFGLHRCIIVEINTTLSVGIENADGRRLDVSFGAHTLRALVQI